MDYAQYLVGPYKEQFIDPLTLNKVWNNLRNVSFLRSLFIPEDDPGTDLV